MNILQISSAGSFGGGERHLIDLIKGLADLGHQVTVAVRPRSPLIPHLTDLPAEQIRTFPLRNSLDLPSARAMRRLVRDLSIDVVHAHLGRDYPLAAYAVRGREEARLVLTRHVLFPLGLLQRPVFARAQAVIAVSSAVRRALLAQGIAGESKIHVIHNGIDVARFATPDRVAARRQIRAQLGLSEQVRLVGTVGSLVTLKGHDDLVRAAAIVTQTDPNTHFTLIGDERPGEKATLHGLRELIVRMGLTHRVHLMRGQTDIPVCLKALDLFVSSSHSESFGLAIVEAMAAGCAVLATSTEGAMEIIENGTTGELTPIGEVDALAEGISRLLADSSVRSRLGQRAETIAKERFDVSRMVDETTHVYRGVAHN